MNNSHDKSTKFYAHNIINHTPDNKQETGGPYIAATGNYIKSDVPHFPSTIMGPPIKLGCPNVQTMY